MRRALGFVVVLLLIGGVVWIGLSSRPSGREVEQRQAAAAAQRFLDQLPDVIGKDMDDAIRELNSVGVDVETIHRGTVTDVHAGTVRGTPAFVVLHGTRPGPHRCPTWFNSCPVIHTDY